jgi:ferric-chelate reductase
MGPLTLSLRLPGLMLWLYDLSWRAFGGESGVLKAVEATLAPAGGGWYRIILPALPDAAAHGDGQDEEVEKLLPAKPLQTYYLNIPSISKLQNHAFTAAKVAAAGDGAVLLFQKTQAGSIKRSAKAQDREWTWKLTKLIDEEASAGMAFKLKLRVEGPYTPVTKGYETADEVLCVVGGTGLTGAYSIARWWFNNRSGEASSHFTLIWTARQREAFQLQEWTELLEMCATSGNILLQAHCSSEEGRLDVQGVLRKHFSVSTKSQQGRKVEQPSTRSAWVYSSGPNGLLTAASDACIDLESEMRRARKAGGSSQYGVSSLGHYTADWEV